ncbi:hypothetical protein EGR_07874 [Echinococcus granulosus]|uniref:G protein-coupled receptor n=1 Tax=Echinococcus granulosus TaxID=6210 RepID=W6UV01_ECHGR|nr:hypothetical protein EGR_07874 [Echinococcus granulosus]EUB57264.1 hypothetical protein EGR_07874 [Echinococcus granulosus]
MFGNNSSPEADLDSLLGDFPVDESSQTFLDLFRLNLVGIERIIFIFLCSCIIIIGLSANCCIILANVLHRLRYSRENDFYTGRARSLSRISIVGANPFKVNLTPENRLSYFSALSGQAKFRYTHVIFAIAIFGLLSCVAFIPLAVINVCGGTSSADADNWIVLICVAWSVFQILFMAVFFFVNTTIQFLSLVFPLTFKLQRNPLWGTFFLIVIVCGIHASLTVVVIFRQLFQTLYEIGAGKKNIELEKSITQIQLVLTLPLAVFILTWIATIIMYAVIVKHIHVATVTVSRISIQPDAHRSSIGSGQSPHPSLWQSVVRKNFHKCLILGAGTLTFYILETPTFLVVYNISPPSSWMLAAHLSVHVITPLLHIMLSKSFRAALGRMLRPRRAAYFFAALRMT